MPLHVRGAVAAAFFKRLNMVDYVTGAAFGVTGLFHKVALGGFAPFDVAVAVALHALYIIGVVVMTAAAAIVRSGVSGAAVFFVAPVGGAVFFIVLGEYYVDAA